MSAPITKYTPPGPVAAAFLQSNAFVRGIRGPIGSGKSTACVMDILRRSRMQNPSPDGVRKTRWAMIRNTFPELKTTTVKTWHQWVSPHIGRWVEQGPPTHHIVDREFDMEVLFLALDSPEDIKKLLSLELTGAWINEAREVPKAILDALTGRVGRYPAKRDGGASWSGVIMDTNPPDSDHWWYKLAEENTPQEFEFFAQPGGNEPSAENLPNLPPRYYVRAAQGKDSDWVKVYINGEYGFVRDGRPVYPEYRDGLHCRPLSLNPKLPIWVGLDFGLTPAATIGQRGLMGNWKIKREVVSDDMGAQRFGQVLGRVLRDEFSEYDIGGIIGDPAGDSRSQTDETTVFQILKAEGIEARPAPTNDFVLRREAVARTLNNLIDGEPGLLIDPACRTLRKAMAGGYNYRRMRLTGEERFQDKPDKNHYSHVAESLQYMLVGAGEAKTVVRRAQSFPRYEMADTDYRMFG